MRGKDAAAKPLGFWMCTALVVGNVIGMGIFMLPASLAPYGLNAFVGWAVTLVGALFVASLFANFARALPGDDGPYAYTRRAFGNGTAFFVMWTYWVSVFISNATIVIGVVGYLTALFPVLSGSPLFAPALALALIWLFVAVNLYGTRTSGRVQMVSTILKLVPLFAVIGLGVYILFATPQQYLAHVPTTPMSFGAMTAAGTIAVFAMLGVECATIPAGKVDRPERTIPRATMFGTVLTALIYIAVSAIALLLIPQAELGSSTAPFVDLFNRYVGPGSGRWIAVFVVICGLGALNGWTLIVAELTVSFVHHGVFPQVLAAPNRFGAPVMALLLSGVLGSAMVLMNYSRSLADGFTFLSVMSTAANLPLYFLGGLAMIKLWRRGVVTGAGGKSGWMLASAVASVLFTFMAAYGMGSEAMMWAVALGAVSLPVFYGRRRIG